MLHVRETSMNEIKHRNFFDRRTVAPSKCANNDCQICKKATQRLYKTYSITQKIYRKYVTCVRKFRLRNHILGGCNTQAEFYELGPTVLLLQGESFWLLSIPEKPKPSGTVIGSVSAIRSYFSRSDFFSYFSNWSDAYERHYQREITRYNKLRNNDQESK